MMDLKTCKVLVTATSFGKSNPRLKVELESAVGEVYYNTLGRPLKSDELHDALRECDGLIAGLDVIDAHALSGSDRLRVIARYGVGVDNVDRECVRTSGIVLTNTPGANSSSVAELTIGLMISLARHIPNTCYETRAGKWPRVEGISLEGRTVGLLGFGSIGQGVARRLAGFGCELLAYDPVPNAAMADQLGVMLLPREEVLARADILSLHLPLTSETQGMVNAEFLHGVKRGALLINTARGELLDETAVFRALCSGQLRGAALDVFSPEPPDPGNPLLSQTNVIVTPHIASHADGATNAMGRMALDDCLAVLRGEEPKYRVT